MLFTIGKEHISLWMEHGKIPKFQTSSFFRSRCWILDQLLKEVVSSDRRGDRGCWPGPRKWWRQDSCSHPPCLSCAWKTCQTAAGRRKWIITSIKIRVTDSSGAKLCQTLSRTNPWAWTVCDRARDICFPFDQGIEVVKDCRKENILYVSTRRWNVQAGDVCVTKRAEFHIVAKRASMPWYI